MGSCFIMQYATENILNQVTNMCAKCYSDIELGDPIHYDTLQYHYLCESCHSEMMEEIESKNRESYSDEYYSEGLFSA